MERQGRNVDGGASADADRRSPWSSGIAAGRERPHASIETFHRDAVAGVPGVIQYVLLALTVIILAGVLATLVVG